MRTLKLKWTLKEANEFAMIFSRILTKDIKELQDDATLYLCALILLKLQKNLTDKILTAKMLFKSEVRVSIRVEQAMAIYTLIVKGHLQWVVKEGTYEELIMKDLFAHIHQKFMV